VYQKAYTLFGGLIELGNAILSRYPINRTEIFPVVGGINPRILIKAEIDAINKELEVYTTHLSLGEESRDNQIDYISKIINDEGDRTILAADLNEQKSEKIKDLAKKTNMKIAPTSATYPSWNTSRTLDYIMTRGFRIGETKAHKEIRLSDHVPITADIYFDE